VPRSGFDPSGAERPRPCRPTSRTVRLVSLARGRLAAARYRRIVGTKAERRAAHERISAYHQAQLAGLLSHVGAAIDRYRSGEIDAYAVDETIHHYHRAAQNCGSSASPAAAAPTPSSSPTSWTA
jgi:hypothetical protein